MRFEDTLKAAGLMPGIISDDGKIRRCRTQERKDKVGWYVLHPDGNGYWGDWSSGSGSSMGHWNDGSYKSRPVDKARIERIRAEERAKRRAAIVRARKLWESSSPMTSLHPYLKSKGLSAEGCDSIRVRNGFLIVPVYRNGSINSLQSISADGVKKFLKDAPVDGGYLVLDRSGAAVSVFCEGFATGLALYQCARQSRVVVAFNAGNLTKVVQALNPTGQVVIAADNDHETFTRRGFNPGLDAARNAAELIDAGIVYPEGIKGSDWSDALMERGPAYSTTIGRKLQFGARYVTGASMR